MSANTSGRSKPSTRSSDGDWININSAADIDDMDRVQFDDISSEEDGWSDDEDFEDETARAFTTSRISVAKPTPEFMKHAIPKAQVPGSSPLALPALPVKTELVLRFSFEAWKAKARILLREYEFMKHATPTPTAPASSHLPLTALPGKTELVPRFSMDSSEAAWMAKARILLHKYQEFAAVQYHPGKLESCVPPLVKPKPREETPTISVRSLGLVDEITPALPSFNVVREEQKSRDSALSPTEKFEKVLTKHVKAPVVPATTMISSSHKTSKPSTPLPAKAKQRAIIAATPRAKPLVEKPQRATFTQPGVSEDGRPEVAEFLIMIPVIFCAPFICTFIICTLIVCFQNIETVFDVPSKLLIYPLVATEALWRAVWWIAQAPFFVLSWAFAVVSWACAPIVAFVQHSGNSATLHNTTIATAPITTHLSPNPLPPISAIQSTISPWSTYSTLPHLPSCESSSGSLTFPNSTSTSGNTYESWHTRGAWEVRLKSEWPFSRHNNSLPVADRCEWLSEGFAKYWGEEMSEKGEVGGFDFGLGDELARALVRYCAQ